MKTTKTAVVTTKTTASKTSKPSPKKKKGKKKDKNGAKQALTDLATSGWAATLLDPFGVHGIRVPDDVVTPSSVASFRERITVTPVYDASSGKYCAGVNFYGTLRTAYQTLATYTASSGALSWNPLVDMTGYSTLSTMARRYRVVSYGMAVYATTAMALNQGMNICAFIPGTDKAAPITPASVSALQVVENVDVKPLNIQQICSICYVPTDRSNYDYHSVDSSSGTTVGGLSYYNPGSLHWVAPDVDPKASFQVVLAYNIEFLPNSSVMSFVNALASTYNLDAMQMALNSSLVRNVFHSVDPESVTATQPSNDIGLQTTIGSLFSSFGGGVASMANPILHRAGQAIAYAGMNRLANWISPQRNYAAIQGIPQGGF